MEGRNSLLSTSPFRDSDPQSHRFIECYQTQDLVSRNEPSLDEWVEDQGGSSSEIVISKLELSVEPCPKKSPSVWNVAMVTIWIIENINLYIMQQETHFVHTVMNPSDPSENSRSQGCNCTTQPMWSQEVGFILLLCYCLLTMLSTGFHLNWNVALFVAGHPGSGNRKMGSIWSSRFFYNMIERTWVIVTFNQVSRN